jgi:PEP-CTERM motif
MKSLTNLVVFLLGFTGIAVLFMAGPVQAASGPSTSCATPDPNATITTCFFDLTGSPSSTQTPSSAVLNGGMFRVPAHDGALGQGTIVGTGVFQPFVRIQEPGNGNLVSNGIESGFNTDGRRGVGPLFRELENHDKGASNWNHSIKLSDIPTVTVCDGGGTTGSNCKQYYEFLLDVNEQGNSPNAGISLDEFKIFTAGTGNLFEHTGANDSKGFTNFQITGATKRYDMDASPGGDASILMDYRNFSGSGNGVDLQALVDVANFAGVAQDSYLYLYSKFGWTGTMCQQTGNNNSPCKTPDGTTGNGVTISSANAPTLAGELNFAADAGFEEWSIRKRTNVSLPSSLLLFGLGLAGFVGSRGRRTRHLPG